MSEPQPQQSAPPVPTPDDTQWKLAWYYPWQAANRVNTLFIPAGISYGLIALWFALWVAVPLFIDMIGYSADINVQPVERLVWFWVFMFPFKAMGLSWLLGQSWHALANWQAYGFDAPMPSARHQTSHYVRDGFMLLCLWLVFIGVAVSIIVAFQYLITGIIDPEQEALITALTMSFTVTMTLGVIGLLPIGMSMMVQSASERSWSSLFQWKHTIPAALDNYGYYWLYLGIALVLSAIISISLVFTCFGLFLIPVFIIPLYWTTLHLMAQRFHVEAESTGEETVITPSAKTSTDEPP